MKGWHRIITLDFNMYNAMRVLHCLVLIIGEHAISHSSTTSQHKANTCHPLRYFKIIHMKN